MPHVLCCKGTVEVINIYTMFIVSQSFFPLPVKDKNCISFFGTISMINAYNQVMQFSIFIYRKQMKFNKY